MSNSDPFDALGFCWDRGSIPPVMPVHSVQRAVSRYRQMLPTFVWDASVLEDNPFTYPEVKTLLDGVTVGGRKVTDQEQVLNLAAASKHLLEAVHTGSFQPDKPMFTALHALVARNEALEWGHFRGEGPEHHYTPHVGLGEHGRFTPLATAAGAPDLNDVFKLGSADLQSLPPFERGTATFLFGGIQQFFFDGNKRTARFVMNGVLMSNGIDAISVPAAKRLEFNETMVKFYRTRDATPMMAFLLDCHPEAEKIRELNPSAGRSLDFWR